MKKKKTDKSPVAAACSVLGTLLLAVLVAACLPLTAPRLFGFHIYTVVSGSMEPAIPIGSLLYIQEAQPEEMEKEDVIAYYGGRDSTAIITHRVVENRVLMGEFLTKGDANQTNDMTPVPYDNVIGRVERSIPAAGKVAEMFTSREGKILAGGLIAAAILLQLLAALAERWTARG